MTDQDVRDMLQKQAASVLPSTDGLDRIQAKLDAPATTRRFPMPLLAAAAIVVVALIGVALAQRDDTTGIVTSPPTSAPTGALQAVWPSNDPEVLNGISAAWAREESPLSAVRLYLQARIGEIPADDDIVVVMGDGAATVTVSGHVQTEIAMRRLDGDGPWYVKQSISALIGYQRLSYDGAVAHADAVPSEDGELSTVVEAPDGASGSGSASGHSTAGQVVDLASGDVEQPHDEPALVVRTVLRTDSGVVALAETLVLAPDPDDSVGTTTTTVPPSSEFPPGVWPWPMDSMQSSLRDPVETARAYIESRIGISNTTTVSAYQAGDGRSGEVVFGGDIQTTVFVRVFEGQWYVEGSASDLVTLHDGIARIEADGWLQSFTLRSSGVSSALQPAHAAKAGDEITDVFASEPDTDLVSAVRFLLTTSDGVKGLTEVRFEPPSPDADPRGVVIAYLSDRLGGREVVVNDFTAIDDTHGEVTWQAGVVNVEKRGGYWSVTDAIGDSIQVLSLTHDEGIAGELQLAQAGTVHLYADGVTWDVRNDIDREGTVVQFSHADMPMPHIFYAVFETDTGFVSLAEPAVS